ncbi:TPA: immunoglobulin-like domain-containing protein, partial [Staphylococcus aureus]
MAKSNKKSIPVKALSTAALLGTISVVGATHHADAATGEKPTIQAPDQQVKYGTTWNPYQNVTAHDKEDGDLTSEIYYEAPYFETTNPGDYNVRYGVYDFDDNLTEVNRNVRVLKEGVEPVNPKPTPPQPEQPSETPNDNTPEQPSDNNPNDVEKPDNTNPSNEPAANEEQPNETPNDTTPEQPSNNNPSDVEKP